MKNFISEDDIEQEVLSMLKTKEFGYNVLICPSSPDMKDNLDDGTGRQSKKDCVLPLVLKESLYKINSTIPKEIVDAEARKLMQDFSDMNLVDVNYVLYKKIKRKY